MFNPEVPSYVPVIYFFVGMILAHPLTLRIGYPATLVVLFLIGKVGYFLNTGHF